MNQWFSRIVEPPQGVPAGPISSHPPRLESYWRFSRSEYARRAPAVLRLARPGGMATHAGLARSTRCISFRTDGPHRGDLRLLLLGWWQVVGGRIAGLTSALLLVLMPRTFAHAHYAHYDMPVTCLWLLAQAAFLKSLRSIRWIVVFGILLGLAAGTKLTGWFAVVPPLAWWALYEGGPLALALLRRITVDGRPRLLAATPLKLGATRALILGISLAALTLYAIQPAWWRAPIWGIERFLVSNLTREKSVPVTSLYLGTVYRFALPWHNTLVLTAVHHARPGFGAGDSGYRVDPGKSAFRSG